MRLNLRTKKYPVFKTEGCFLVCFLNTPKLLWNSELWISFPNKWKILLMARGITSRLFDFHCGLFHYMTSHIFSFVSYTGWEKPGGCGLHRPQKINCSPNCISGHPVSLQSPDHHYLLTTKHFPINVPQAHKLSLYKAELCVSSHKPSVLEFSPIINHTTIYLVSQTGNWNFI